MKRIIALVIAICAFALPSIASAHTGSVTCDSTGVVFHYDANFPTPTVVTEHVTYPLISMTQQFTVAPHVVSSDTVIIPVGVTSIVASSTWSGGGTIPPATLNCPVPPPPVNPTPPPVVPPTPTCPTGETQQSYINGILTCLITVNPPVPPTPVKMLCPKGDKNLGVKGGILVCEKTKTKIVHKMTKIIRWVQWCPLPPKKTPGVTG